MIYRPDSVGHLGTREIWNESAPARTSKTKGRELRQPRMKFDPNKSENCLESGLHIHDTREREMGRGGKKERSQTRCHVHAELNHRRWGEGERVLYRKTDEVRERMGNIPKEHKEKKRKAPDLPNRGNFSLGSKTRKHHLVQEERKATISEERNLRNGWHTKAKREDSKTWAGKKNHNSRPSWRSPSREKGREGDNTIGGVKGRWKKFRRGKRGYQTKKKNDPLSKKKWVPTPLGKGKYDKQF